MGLLNSDLGQSYIPENNETRNLCTFLLAGSHGCSPGARQSWTNSRLSTIWRYQRTSSRTRSHQLQHYSSRTRPGEENGLWKWGGLMHKIILHGYQGRRRRRMQKRAALLPVRLLPWIVLYVWAMSVICISKQNTKYGSKKKKKRDQKKKKKKKKKS